MPSSSSSTHVSQVSQVSLGPGGASFELKIANSTPSSPTGSIGDGTAESVLPPRTQDEYDSQTTSIHSPAHSRQHLGDPPLYPARNFFPRAPSTGFYHPAMSTDSRSSDKQTVLSPGSPIDTSPLYPIDGPVDNPHLLPGRATTFNVPRDGPPKSFVPGLPNQGRRQTWHLDILTSPLPHGPPPPPSSNQSSLQQSYPRQPLGSFNHSYPAPQGRESLQSGAHDSDAIPPNSPNTPYYSGGGNYWVPQGAPPFATVHPNAPHSIQFPGGGQPSPMQYGHPLAGMQPVQSQMPAYEGQCVSPPYYGQTPHQYYPPAPLPGSKYGPPDQYWSAPQDPGAQQQAEYGLYPSEPMRGAPPGADGGANPLLQAGSIADLMSRT